MSQITVKINSLKTSENSLSTVYSRLNSLQNQINSMSSQIRHNGSSEAFRSVGSSVSSIASSVGRQKSSISSMKNSLNQIQRIYKNTESKIDLNFHQRRDVDWSQTNSWGLSYYFDTDGWNSNWNSFWNDLKEKGKFSDSFFEGVVGISGAILGVDAQGKLTGQLGYVEAKHGGYLKWDDDEGEMKVGYKAGVEASAAKGKAEGSWGIASGEVEAAAITGAVSGEAAFALMQKGEFDPELKIGAKAEGSVLSGSAKGQLGSDDLNVFGKAEGTLLGAEAEAGIKISDEGVEGYAGAEAYLAKGEVSGGFEIFGIEVKTTAEGKAGAIGAKAGGSVDGDGATAEIGGSLGLGIGLKVEVDWSQFTDNLDELGDKVSKAWANRPSWLK